MNAYPVKYVKHAAKKPFLTIPVFPVKGSS